MGSVQPQHSPLNYQLSAVEYRTFNKKVKYNYLITLKKLIISLIIIKKLAM